MLGSRSRWSRTMGRDVARAAAWALVTECAESIGEDARERLITPWETYLIEDRRSWERHTIVWEIATVQWGAPVSIALAGLALNWVSRSRTISVAAAIGVVGGMMIAVLAIANLLGRLLWRVGLRCGRDLG